jgi:protein gp37
MSKIEWTHRSGTKSEVWNPVSGCSLESAGCANCYAMHFAHRFSGPRAPFEGLTVKKNSGVKWTGRIQLNEDRLRIPLSWRSPRTVFVNSMSDLFHPNVPFDFIDNVFAVMAMCPDHVFIILTKRDQLMVEYFTYRSRQWSVWQAQMMINPDAPEFAWPLPNVWIGVSAEDQENFDKRVESLMRIKATVKVVSIEPQLGPINIFNRFESNEFNNFWILNGGESGHKARPSHPNWFRTIRDQCKYMGVPYFFKQHGGWEQIDIHRLDQRTTKVGYFDEQEVFHQVKRYVDLPTNIHRSFYDKRVTMTMVGKHASGNLLDGVQHLEFPA